MSDMKMDGFDKTISVESLQMSPTPLISLENLREELMFFKDQANNFNKKACFVGILGVVVFILVAFTGLVDVPLEKLIKAFSIFIGSIIGFLLIISLFFTILYSYGYIKVKRSVGVAVGGVFLFLAIPFLSVFILAAIPLWNSFVTKRLNVLFVEAGLEPVLVSDDDI